MIEIRIHGRGGQGAVIGGMLLAKAVFAEGKYVQAFPSFGVERRGAPVEAFVRIDDHIINARYQIYHPDHIIILDPTLMNSSFAFAGLKKNGTILINTKESPDHFKKHPIIKDAVELQLLLQNQYDVVLIATGAHKSSPMNITGEKLTGVISGLSFLCEQSKGKNQKIGKKVIVIGGGNTAIDAARVAKRLGSNVKILYRRTREEMPAFSHTINDAIDEGIDINFLTSPCSIIQKESSERLVNNPFAEIELECDKKTLAGELARCLHCGRCIDCDNCYIYCPDISIVKLDNRYEIDYTHCKGCGICVTECPRAAMELIEEPTGF